MTEIEIIRQRLLRESRAREEAETLLEEKSNELQKMNETLSRSAEELARKEARTRQIIDTANDAFISTDIFGTIVEWNVTAEVLFGWSRDEMIGRSIDLVLRPKDNIEADGVLALILNGIGEGNRGDMLGQHRDGHVLPVELSISSMAAEDSFYFNAFVHDISSKLNIQEKLHQSRKLESIGQLAAGIAHEINTPTQYIGDNVEFLRDTFEGLEELIKDYLQLLQAIQSKTITESKLRESLDILEKADLEFTLDEVPAALAQALEGIERVSEIVNSMKEFAHPGTDCMSNVNLNHAIESTATVCRSEWKYISEMKLDLDPNLPMVPCLPGEFNQVILNLIVNAAHAIEEKHGTNQSNGLITISTRLADQEVEIRVTDNGCGIPQHVHDRIFDPFFTTKEVGKGSGQGLSLARTVIADKHAGSLSAETKPGEGTTFIIRLPLSATQDKDC